METEKSYQIYTDIETLTKLSKKNHTVNDFNRAMETQTKVLVTTLFTAAVVTA